MGAQHINAMQIKTSTIFPVLFAIAAIALAPHSASFAGGHHATKPAPHKKAAPAVNALPPLAAQAALAANPPALPAKAWLLMDFDSGEVLASANADEPLAWWRDVHPRRMPSEEPGRLRRWRTG